MNVQVVLLPSALRDEQRVGRCVVVFDVLRATTTMTAALAAGVGPIFVFSDLDAARSAAETAEGSRLLCGERACLRPAGFDLGNSPGAFEAGLHGGRPMYMATTNGTRAIVAARGAGAILIGALVNASAVAERLRQLELPATLLCAGTNGGVAAEDLLGAGAVIAALHRQGGVTLGNDEAAIAASFFEHHRQDLRTALAQATGGRNVSDAGLSPDIDFAARPDALGLVGEVEEHPLRVILAGQGSAD